MFFTVLVFHSHDRMSSVSRVLHAATWHYLAFHLSDHFSCSPKVVKEAIITDISDLVQEFWRISSSDGAVGALIFEMRRLLKILQVCLKILPFLGLLADKIFRS